MKRSSSLVNYAALAVFILAGVCAVTAPAQTGTVTPILECVAAPNEDGRSLVYFGYNNTTGVRQAYPPGTSENFFSPSSSDRGQPYIFPVGEYRAVFFISINFGVTPNITWNLGGQSVTVSAASTACRTGTLTYQGRLSAGGTQASGNYDLKFQLFDKPTGGNSVGSMVSVPGVAVTNGVFTVSLDFGSSALNTPGSRFLEIGVRPSGANDPYTTLAPRQPLTDSPSAVFAYNAQTASSALEARVADNANRLGGIHAGDYVLTADARLNSIQNTSTQQANSNFNISGNGTIGGDLSANTISTNSDYNIVVTGRSTSNVGTWLSLNNTSPGGRTWSLISSGSANGEGAGNLVFYNPVKGTQMVLSSSALIVNGGVLARGGAPGGNGANGNGYAFAGNGGDNDSGLFSEANGQVSLYTNAAERVRVTDGGLQVFGTLTANTKNFKIDHPLDPANKTLNYTSVESPDMLNIYNGNATTDDKGEAIVTMPNYFSALNRDFRYQLTVIGTFAQAIVGEKINNNKFLIRTDKPRVEVSWQVTGIRRDKFAEDQRTPVEQNKPDAEKGKCLYAPACGKEQK